MHFATLSNRFWCKVAIPTWIKCTYGFLTWMWLWLWLWLRLWLFKWMTVDVYPGVNGCTFVFIPLRGTSAFVSVMVKAGLVVATKLKRDASNWKRILRVFSTLIARLQALNRLFDVLIQNRHVNGYFTERRTQSQTHTHTHTNTLAQTCMLAYERCWRHFQM